MSIYLSDDGTMDTVVVCSDCGQEFRGTYDGEGDPTTGYDDFVKWLIDEITGEHVCEEEEEEATS